MPTYTVNVTITVPAWCVIEADNVQEAIESARAVGPRHFERDDDWMEYVIDSWSRDDDDATLPESGEPRSVAE